MTSNQLDADEARAELYEIMRADHAFEEKVDRALELGEAYLGVQNAHLTRIDQRIDFWEAIASTDPPEGDFPPGQVLDLQTTYCRRVIEQGSTIALSDAPEQGWADDPAVEEHGLHCYHGTPLNVDGEVWGTLCFVSEEPRDTTFSESETLFAELIARLLEHEIRHTREAAELNLQSNLIGVLSRVLRHNLRNDLNVIRGQLTMMADRSDEPLLQNEAAVSKIDKLVDLANTARQIESIASSDLDRQPVELNALVNNIIEKVQTNHPEATFTVDGPDEVYLEAIPSLRTGLQELIENAAKHSGDAPDVTVVLASEDDAVQIEVIDDGPGLPEQEREVLREGAETPLIHGSGLGLWLAYWIVANHDGSIRPEATGEGTHITVTLPRTSQLSKFADSESLLGRFHREQDKFEAVFEESFDAIVLIGDDGHYTDVNESGADLFGLSVEELRGRHISEFVPDEFDIESTWLAQMDTDRERDTFPLVRADGSERTVEYAAVTDIVPGQHLAIMRDVTEQVRREAELQETRNRMELAIEATDAVVWEWDIETDTVTTHPSPHPIIGEQVDELDDFVEHTHPDDQLQVREAIENALETGEPYDVTFRVWNEDDIRWVEDHGEVQLDETGDPERIVGVAHDVTDRTVGEQQLRKKAAFNELALENVIDFYWGMDPDGRITDWSDTDGRVTGYTSDEAIGQSATAMFPEHEQQNIVDSIEELREQGTASVTADFLTKNGEEVRYLFDGTVVTDNDGRVERMYGLGRDISNRFERARRLEALSEGFPDLCFVFDESGTYRDVLTSPANDDILIGEPAELIGRALSEVHSADHAAFVSQQIERTLDTGQPQTFQRELQVPAGMRVFEGCTHPLPESAEGDRLVAMVIRDITDLPSGEEVRASA